MSEDNALPFIASVVAPPLRCSTSTAHSGKKCLADPKCLASVLPSKAVPPDQERLDSRGGFIPPRSDNALVGLINCSCCCYLNAFLQAFASQNALISSLAHPDVFDSSNAFVKRLTIVLLSLRTSRLKYLTAQQDRLVASLRLRRDLQEDPSEFFLVLISNVLLRGASPQAAKALRDCLEIGSLTRVRCASSQCSYSSDRPEPAWTLNYAFPEKQDTAETGDGSRGPRSAAWGARQRDPASVAAWLQSLDCGSEERTDAKCSCGECLYLSSEVSSWPSTIVVTVVRHSYTGRKNLSPVSLDPAPFRLRASEYALSAVVVHGGAGTDEGHYVCWVRCTSEERQEPMWVLLNDRQSEKPRAGPLPGHVPRNCYMIFYTRIDDNAVSILGERSLSERSLLPNAVVAPAVSEYLRLWSAKELRYFALRDQLASVAVKEAVSFAETSYPEFLLAITSASSYYAEDGESTVEQLRQWAGDMCLVPSATLIAFSRGAIGRDIEYACVDVNKKKIIRVVHDTNSYRKRLDHLNTTTPSQSTMEDAPMSSGLIPPDSDDCMAASSSGNLGLDFDVLSDDLIASAAYDDPPVATFGLPVASPVGVAPAHVTESLVEAPDNVSVAVASPIVESTDEKNHPKNVVLTTVPYDVEDGSDATPPIGEDCRPQRPSVERVDVSDLEMSDERPAEPVPSGNSFDPSAIARVKSAAPLELLEAMPKCPSHPLLLSHDALINIKIIPRAALDVLKISLCTGNFVSGDACQAIEDVQCDFIPLSALCHECINASVLSANDRATAKQEQVNALKALKERRSHGGQSYSYFQSNEPGDDRSLSSQPSGKFVISTSVLQQFQAGQKYWADIKGVHPLRGFLCPCVPEDASRVFYAASGSPSTKSPTWNSCEDKMASWRCAPPSTNLWSNVDKATFRAVVQACEREPSDETLCVQPSTSDIVFMLPDEDQDRRVTMIPVCQNCEAFMIQKSSWDAIKAGLKPIHVKNGEWVSHYAVTTQSLVDELHSRTAPVGQEPSDRPVKAVLVASVAVMRLWCWLSDPLARLGEDFKLDCFVEDMLRTNVVASLDKTLCKDDGTLKDGVAWIHAALQLCRGNREEHSVMLRRNAMAWTEVAVDPCDVRRISFPGQRRVLKSHSTSCISITGPFCLILESTWQAICGLLDPQSRLQLPSIEMVQEGGAKGKVTNLSRWVCTPCGSGAGRSGGVAYIGNAPVMSCLWIVMYSISCFESDEAEHITSLSLHAPTSEICRHILELNSFEPTLNVSIAIAQNELLVTKRDFGPPPPTKSDKIAFEERKEAARATAVAALKGDEIITEKSASAASPVVSGTGVPNNGDIIQLSDTESASKTREPVPNTESDEAVARALSNMSHLDSATSQSSMSSAESDDSSSDFMERGVRRGRARAKLPPSKRGRGRPALGRGATHARRPSSGKQKKGQLAVGAVVPKTTRHIQMTPDSTLFDMGFRPWADLLVFRIMLADDGGGGPPKRASSRPTAFSGSVLIGGGND